ncbi:helix-turn-helix domain-containing protein [Amycolatopsis sp. MtRt-6]|uniref:helix-turn-helix domain-containing protein n=1 Tax=Amycolatopsis sp. MtRt-6 TaxID=2792782 RepID=UPI001A8D17BA|nr:AraC family transcriptional regulator [Amycolatopsis sp. MtRt-6]
MGSDFTAGTPTVLIVGPDIGRCAAVGALLGDFAEVRITGTGDVAARHIVERRPDVLLVDGRAASADSDLHLAVTGDHARRGRPVVLDAGAPEQLSHHFRGIPWCETAFRRDVVGLAETVANLIPAQPSSGLRNGHVRRVIDFVARRYRDRLTVGTIAAETGLSSTYLSHLFKLRTGMTVRDYVTRVHVEVAKCLLRDRDDTLEIVAGKAGFADASHLSRVLRRRTGHTPARYRN